MAGISLAALNSMDAEQFTQVLGGVFENAPWVARGAHGQRPFATVDALYRAMWNVVETAERPSQIELLRAHPELGRDVPGLTGHSSAEQRRLGLDKLAPDEAARFATANTAYRNRFGFPFVVAVRGMKDREAILAALKNRLGHSQDMELRIALVEVGRIARMRLQDMISQGGLTTHVLDIGRGVPAAGLKLELMRLDGSSPGVLSQHTTNNDGRPDSPLLQGSDFVAGLYEIVFYVSSWRIAQGLQEGFYEDIPVRFRVVDSARSHHVPLILAPHGYSTYRGS